KSLGTRDPAVAKHALPNALDGVYRAFDEEEARLLGEGARPISDLIVPDDHDFQRAIWEFIHDENRLDEKSRAARPTQGEIGRRIELTQQALQASPPKGDLDKFLRLNGLAAFVDGPQLDAERRHILADELRRHLAEN